MATSMCLLLAGCYKATFHRDASVMRSETHEEWTTFWVFGLVGHEQFEVKHFCPSGEATEIRTGGNVGTVLVGALTLGIYTPRKVYVSCAGNDETSSRQLEIDIDEDGRPVHAQMRSGSEFASVQIMEQDNSNWQMSALETSK